MMSFVVGAQCRLSSRRLILSTCRHCQGPSCVATRALHTTLVQRHDESQSAEAASRSSRSEANGKSQLTQTTNRPGRGLGLLKGLKGKGSRQGPGASGQAGAKRFILGQNADQPIRARFAPSPTGYLHLGSLRTALFNNIAARASKGGAFILRIEDTDQSRLVPDAEQRLLEDLKWAGLSWDEGPDCGGPHGPYRQSERLPIYREHVQQLVDKGHAYRCFCSAEQLEAQKRELHEAGKPTIYNGTCRSIDASESSQRAASGETHVVRFKGDTFGQPKLRDAIYGHFQKKDTEEDFIILKSDGFPTYHLANVVDDHLMEVTHVIRGEEWLISAPKHVALYQAFGWQPPTFAHLGLLVNQDGSKLSKRNDDVNLSKYKEGRAFPMALLAWLANLGSSFKSGAKAPRSVEDVAEALTFKFTRGGIKLNFGKLDYFNSSYRDLLLRHPLSSLPPHEVQLLDSHLVQPTLKTLKDFTQSGIPAWPQISPLELIPQLSQQSQSPGTESSYIHAVLASRDGGYQTPTELVQQHPYLFWRVPEQIYKSSLAAMPPDERILDALKEVLAQDDFWTGVKTPMEGMLEMLKSQDIGTVTIHNALRHVGAGGQDVVSQSSGRMFTLLGRQEWSHRLKTVRRLLKE